MGKTLHDLVNERLGVGGSAPSSEVADYLKQSIKQLMDTYQLTKMMDAVTRLQEGQDGGGGAAVDPFAGLKALGFNLTELIQTLHRFSERLEAALEKERAEHLDTKIALAKHVSEDRRAEVERDTGLAKLLVDMVRDRNSHPGSELVDAIRQELRELRQQINPKVDPVTDALLRPLSESISSLIRQRLDDRPPAPPSPLQQLEESLALVRKLQSLVPQSNPQTEERKWRVQEERLRVMERHAERKLQLRKETQEMWAGAVTKIADTLGNVVDKLFGAGLLAGNGSAPAAQPTPAPVPTTPNPAYSTANPTPSSDGAVSAPEAIPNGSSAPEGPWMICPRCGQGFMPPPRRATFSCPNPQCRLAFVRSDGS